MGLYPITNESLSNFNSARFKIDFRASKVHRPKKGSRFHSAPYTLYHSDGMGWVVGPRHYPGSFYRVFNMSCPEEWPGYRRRWIKEEIPSIVQSQRLFHETADGGLRGGRALFRERFVLLAREAIFNRCRNYPLGH